MLLPDRRSNGILRGKRDQLPWPKDQRFRILTIDGGGIRGILPASVLAELELRYLDGKSVGNYFDLIAGTSTGGILALALGQGISGQRILSVYRNAGADIFPERAPASSDNLTGLVRRGLSVYKDLTRYKYERDALQAALVKEFGNTLLGESERRLAVPSFDGYGEVFVFKTPHHPDYKQDWAAPLVDIALATSAAPTFFSTFRNGDRQFADGGVWANNPIMIALVDALACYDVDRSQIDILSLGCADGEYRITADQELKGGLWHWREIMSAAMHLQGQNAWGQAGLLIGRDNILRVDQVPPDSPIAMDDFHRSSSELPEIGIALVNQLGEQIAEKFLKTAAAPFKAYYGPRAD